MSQQQPRQPRQSNPCQAAGTNSLTWLAGVHSDGPCNSSGGRASGACAGRGTATAILHHAEGMQQQQQQQHGQLRRQSMSSLALTACLSLPAGTAPLLPVPS